MLPRPPSSTLFPYTTLFRSQLRDLARHVGELDRPRLQQVPQIGERGLERPQERAGDLLRSEEQRLNSSHLVISYAVFCLKKKKNTLITNKTIHYMPHQQKPI